MKKIIIIIIFLFQLNGAYSQIAYYDAVQLSKLLDNNKHFKNSAAQKDSVLSILNKYLGGEISHPSEFNDSTKNPFIWKYFDVAQTFGGGFGLLSLSKTATSLGGLDITNLADGLAKFLVKRTKQELSIAFFEKFKTEISKPEYKDLKTLFPHTWDLLDAIGDEIYDYQKYLQNLREAFKNDINTLDENLPDIIPNHKVFFNSHFELEVSLKSGCYITSSLKNNIHPGDILDNYPMDYLKKMNEIEYFDKNWSGAIQSLQLISESLRDTASNDSSYWVNMKQIRDLVNNKEAFRIYLGLVYQVAKNKYESVQFKNGSLIEIMNQVKDFDKDYPAYKKYILNFGVKVNQLNDMIKAYQKPSNDSLAIELYSKYFKSSVDFIEYCTRVSELPHIESTSIKDLHNDLKIYFKISYEVSDLSTDINRKNYSSAVNHIINIYNEVKNKPLKKDLDEEKNEVNKLSKAAGADSKRTKQAKKISRAKGKLAKAAGVELTPGISAGLDTLLLDSEQNTSQTIIKKKEELESLKDSLDKSKEILEKLARYGSFFATVATAKSSEEVESAIEVFALPSGSSRIKRESCFNVSLNAYVGPYLGWEQIPGIDRPACWKPKYQFFNSFGVTAPVGIAISKGCHHWSFSVFASLIDLGAPTAFRFTNDSVESIPTIHLEDIVSPGIFISVGLGKTPLSFNFGYQNGPRLREVADENNVYKDHYNRLSMSLCVDIPVFNFYTKSKD